MVPKWKADLCKVGEGRAEPNINPYLPPPQGRFEWSMNPFKMFNQLIGPGIRRKVYTACCLLLYVILIIIILPYIGMHLIAELLNPFNYKRSKYGSFSKFFFSTSTFSLLFFLTSPTFSFLFLFSISTKLFELSSYNSNFLSFLP